jgi:trk system potassium uptake protein TrkA
MRVIIIGAGEVGYQIAKFLSSESIDVVVIDKDKEKLKRVSNELDVSVIEGEGGNPSTLKLAEATRADILLAVTDKDETNMIACLLAKAMFGIPRKIARIRDIEYFNNKELLGRSNLDIDPAINPELELAHAVIRLIEVPCATDIENFANGQIKVIGLKIPENSKLIGKTLKQLRKITNRKFLIGLIVREDKAMIPFGDCIIQAGDIMYVPVKKEEIHETIKQLGITIKKPKKIMILGGGMIGYYIASTIEEKIQVKIIEQKEERCKFLIKNLKKTIVLHADGAERKVLLEENISDMDIFIAVSNNDELNIMISLLARKLGAKDAIAIVNKPYYILLAHSLGLQAVLSPRLITASRILRYVRRADILSMTSIAEAKAEIIEGRIKKTSLLCGKRLDKAKTRGSLIGAIIRSDQVIIPSGEDSILEGDNVIIFYLRESVKEVEKILS